LINGGEKMNIYVICNAGMSTSVLVKRMRESAQARGIDVNIEAFSVEVLDKIKDQADVLLVGPQIRHMLPQIKSMAKENCPVEMINMSDYGLINGAKILDRAITLLKK
jgi:PTS system cellobiose-specific IIB component